MPVYTIATDAVSVDIEAANVDQAARMFAIDESIRGVDNLDDLLGWISRAGGFISVDYADGPPIAGVSQRDGRTRVYDRNA